MKNRTRKFLCIFLTAALFAAGSGAGFAGETAGAAQSIDTTEEVQPRETEEAAEEILALHFRQTGGDRAASYIEIYRGIKVSGDGIEADPKTPAALEGVEAGDILTVRIKGEGCYTCTKRVLLTERDLSRGFKTIEYSLDLRKGNGYEAGEIKAWTDEAEEKLFSPDTLTGVNRSALSTPAFQGGKAAHQFTGIEEACAYLENVCRKSRQAYLYDLRGDGTFPAVIFTETDLSRAADVETAIDLIKENGKLKVMYQAQIHGNEPAAGEGALAVCGGLAENNSFLDAMDIVIIPYVNESGSLNFTRSESGSLDLNRDALRLRSQTTRKIHSIYSRLMPHMFFDSHEFAEDGALKTDDEGKGYLKQADDIKLGCLENLNGDERVYNLDREAVSQTLSVLSGKGFRSSFYPPNWNSTTSCNYARMQHSLTVLIESYGIGLGRNHFERRVLSQYETVMALLQYAFANSQRITDTVDTARADFVKQGKKYSADRRFVLTHQVSQRDPLTARSTDYDFKGSPISQARQISFYNRAKSIKSRSLPTAYLIPKSAAGSAAAKEILKANGVKYFEISSKKKVSVSQYGGTAKAAKILKKKTVRFSKGAYVFYMDQPAANLIAACLEPDAGDGRKNDGSFVQAGILKKGKSGYPIYRYTGANPQKSLR